MQNENQNPSGKSSNSSNSLTNPNTPSKPELTGTQGPLITQGQLPLSPPCHNGAKYIFTDPKTNQKWYAGGTTRNFGCPKGAILVALTFNAIDIPVLANIPLVPNQEPTIFIDWGDGTKGPLKTKQEYEGLLRALRGHGGDVAAACVGGHGRTGTFISIMSWLMEIPQNNSKKPIEYIRDIYCKEAVETKVQFELIRDITGEDETALFVPTHSTYYDKGWSNYSGGYSGYYKTGKKDFDPSADPDKENVKLGYFWGKLPNSDKGLVKRYNGYPTGAGAWLTDSMGWYWEWDKDNKTPEYIPIQESDLDDLDIDEEEEYYKMFGEKLDREDMSGTLDSESGYNYPDNTSNQGEIKVYSPNFLNGYQNGDEPPF